MSLNQLEKSIDKFHKQTGQDNNANYLAIKHRYGFLNGFKDIYQALVLQAKVDEKEITYDYLESFFSKFTKNMGLEPEFNDNIIDKRLFSLTVNIEGEELVYDIISAGQLLSIAPELIPFIALPEFKYLHVTFGDKIYWLTLKEDNK